MDQAGLASNRYAHYDAAIDIAGLKYALQSDRSVIILVGEGR